MTINLLLCCYHSPLQIAIWMTLDLESTAIGESPLPLYGNSVTVL